MGPRAPGVLLPGCPNRMTLLPGSLPWPTPAVLPGCSPQSWGAVWVPFPAVLCSMCSSQGAGMGASCRPVTARGPSGGACGESICPAVGRGGAYQGIGVGVGQRVEYGMVRSADGASQPFLAPRSAVAREGELGCGFHQPGWAHRNGTSVRLSHSDFSTKPSQMSSLMFSSRSFGLIRVIRPKVLAGSRSSVLPS